MLGSDKKTLASDSSGKGPLERARHRQVDGVEMVENEVEWQVVTCIHLV
jgi:hypothetical protein